VNYLADTHACIWFFEGNNKLSKKARKIMNAFGNHIFVSIASVWELAIKISIGKMDFEGNSKGFISTIAEHDFELLEIEPQHIQIVETLPFHHRDPFDRLLVATAMAERMPIITVDDNIPLYDVECLW
jgi:PIN domain nuclease of toxin-antitoxin system